eukprot:scaffold4273_cov389-Prasinococcus_capsulatus_cf.AAC.3
MDLDSLTERVAHAEDEQEGTRRLRHTTDKLRAQARRKPACSRRRFSNLLTRLYVLGASAAKLAEASARQRHRHFRAGGGPAQRASMPTPPYIIISACSRRVRHSTLKGLEGAPMGRRAAAPVAACGFPWRGD